MVRKVLPRREFQQHSLLSPISLREGQFALSLRAIDAAGFLPFLVHWSRLTSAGLWSNNEQFPYAYQLLQGFYRSSHPILFSKWYHVIVIKTARFGP